MFKALEIGSTIDMDPAHLVSLERSTNTQSLALGGGPKRPTRAFILGFYDPTGWYRVMVFLGRLERDHLGRPAGLLFRCDPDRVPLASYEALRRESAVMVQSQGFQMERVEFQAAGHEERASLLSELPFAGVAAPPPPRALDPSHDGPHAHALRPPPPPSGPAQTARNALTPTPGARVEAPSSRDDTASDSVRVLGRMLALF